MSGYERGPLLTFEITWASGHIETIRAHQVILPQPPSPFMGDADGGTGRVMFHGEIDGVWQLLLAANEDDIRSIRNTTNAAEDIS